MNKNTFEEISTLCKKFNSTFPIKLYFIVKSLDYTRRTQGLGDQMYDYLNLPLEFQRIGNKSSLILIIPDDPPKPCGPVTYFYDYRDLDLTTETTKFIKAMLKPTKIYQPRSLLKFDEKNIYNFNKNNKQK
jgi:hypothetical protein